MKHAGLEQLPFFLWGILIAWGLLVYFWGVRGRRIGISPFCRRCRYSLTGLPAETQFCPECGNDIQQSTAIIRGVRKRYKPLVITGIVLTLVGLAGLGEKSVSSLLAVDWFQYRPVSWLMDDLEAAPGPKRDRAAKELLRRMRAGSFDDGSWKLVIDRSLQAHAKSAKAWDTRWSDLFVAAGQANKLSDQQLLTFLHQVADIRLYCKTKIRHGGDFRIDEQVAFDWCPFTLQGSYEVAPLLIGDVAVTNYHFKSHSMPESNLASGTSFTPGSLGSPEAVALPNGPAQIVANGHFSIRISAPFKTKEFVFDEQGAIPVEIVPEDTAIDTFSVDPKQRQAINDSVPEVVLLLDGPRKLVARIRAKNPPAALAMDVLMKPATGDGPTIECGQLSTFSAWPDSRSTFVKELSAPLSPGLYDVILRPSRKRADKLSTTPGVFWGEKIVKKNVPLKEAQPSDLYVMDESLRSTIMQSIILEPITVSDRSGRPLSIRFTIKNNLPVRIDADVFIRSGSTETTAHSFSAEPSRLVGSTSEYGYNTYGDPPKVEPPPTTVDIVLKPRIRPGQHDAADGKPWGYEIIFKNQPLPAGLPSN
jgi:hypothetical protein